MGCSARFDDLRGEGRAFRLTRPLSEIVATHPEQVRPALREAQAEAGRGRWVAGFVAYEAAAGLDRAIAERDAGGWPLVWFGVFAGREDVAPVAPPDPAASLPWWAAPDGVEDWHHAAVARVREEIAEGNTYQVNLGTRLSSIGAADRQAVYRQLCHAQRSAYGAFLDAGRFAVASASPELFFSLDGRRITTRPMKGTARRGRWPDEDLYQRAALEASAKDRAENLMIVDLLRNDLGRIAEFGSVRVEQLFAVERYETVWQLTSTITAQVRAGTGLDDVFAALFPCGSVTGAPKLRTMQIIAELEPAPRGVFCGAIGLLSPTGDASFAVGIRTVTFAGQVATYGVGSGVTWDSSAPGEYAELLDKTRVLTDRRPSFELLETMRFEPGRGLRHREAHLRRVAASAEYFGYAFDACRTGAALDEAVAGMDVPARVRLRVARDGTPAATVAALPARDDRPVRVTMTEVRVDASNVFVFHKTTHREHLRDMPDTALMLNEGGELCESPIANVAVELDGQWWTPPLESGCLPGIERGYLLEQGRLRERVLRAEDVRRATGLALISSLRGWRPAILDQRTSVEAWSGTYV